MSKRTRALVLGATLAAMNLAGLTTVAHAQATTTDARRQPANAKRRTWTSTETPSRRGHRRHGQQSRNHRSRPPRTPPSSGSWPESATPSPTAHPPRCPPQCPTNRAGQPGWLLASLGVLAAALALAGGLAVLAAKRAGRRARIGHAA